FKSGAGATRPPPTRARQSRSGRWPAASGAGSAVPAPRAAGSLYRLRKGRERATEEAFAAELLGHVCFFTDVMGQGVAVILRSLNLAERLGPSPQLARSYALTSTSAGIQGA